jgi:glycosyltransferase involved in cell wall biosynthesis
MLSIRPLVYRYANDMSIAAVSKLERGKLDLYGEGPLLSDLRAQQHKSGANIEFHPQFLTQQEITSLHQEYGMYLSPSRTDAQGVSMCEAMSSGLPVISTPTQAIPEFVTDGETGFLCETPEEMAEKISWLQDNPEEMVRMGEQASNWINRNCASDIVVEREFELARSLI